MGVDDDPRGIGNRDDMDEEPLPLLDSVRSELGFDPVVQHTLLL